MTISYLYVGVLEKGDMQKDGVRRVVCQAIASLCG